jgi:hemolysin activation/secretion protein
VVTEVRYTFDEIKLPLIDVPAGLQAYGFGDWGRVYHIESNTRKSFETLASAGGGIRFNVSSHISGQVEGAVPLFGRVAASGTEGLNWRVFFVVNARY